jgi:DNA-binding MarR family transcriptional regulator
VTRSDAVEEELLDRFQMLMRHIAESHAPGFLGVDVTMPQAKVLYLVSLRPGVPMSAIAAELGVGPSAVSGLVDRLVALGHIARQEDPSDRRQQLVTITPAGSAVLDRMRELRAEVMRRLLAGLSPAELEAMRTSLIALDREVQRLSEQSPPAATQVERTPA